MFDGAIVSQDASSARTEASPAVKTLATTNIRTLAQLGRRRFILDSVFIAVDPPSHWALVVARAAFQERAAPADCRVIQTKIRDPSGIQVGFPTR
ncbi:MAG: hypothetical protein KDA90_24305, partial [Planctomycetaceae bacterium]|nr:hypothetical protein [Planctomycetaceae bacterium]